MVVVCSEAQNGNRTDGNAGYGPAQGDLTMFQLLSSTPGLSICAPARRVRAALGGH